MLCVRLLGELELEKDGVPLAPPQSRKACALLGWLALNPGMHPRARLASLLWPDVLDASARASLRSAIWALRRALGDAGDRLVTTRERVGLEAGPDLWVDAVAVEELAAEGDLDAALELCRRGELLPAVDDDWAFEARDRQRERHGELLARRAAEAEAAGDARGAVALARERAALDALDEDAARDLIRLLTQAGDRAGAAAAYGRLRDRMRRELGISPAPETRALVEALRADEPASAGEAKAPAERAGPALAVPELPMLGRDAELEVLAGAWERARQGAGGAVLVAGEAGIGKTRLATELLRGAQDQGARVASCAALDLGGAAPFALWAELLRDLTAELDAASRPPWASELARLSPVLERRIGAAAPEATAGSAELRRTRLFEAAAEMLEDLGRERPLALLLDDVHLADAPSLELLAYAARRVDRLPVLIVLTRRELPRSASADRLAQALRSRGVLVDDLALGPLEPGAVARLASAVAPLGGERVEQVVVAAEGNPLLAVESARALAAGERDVTAGVRESVRVAAAGLGLPARALAELAAVAGRDLDPAEVEALPLEDHADAAEDALDSGLLVARGDRLGYRHSLLREAVTADLPHPRRARLHEALADSLARSEEGAHGRLAAEIARHLRLAGRPARAAWHLRRAAEDARRVAALAEAAAYLEEALRIEPRDAASLAELAEIEAWRGRRAASDEAFAAALELLPPGDPALSAVWMRRGRSLRGAFCDPRASAEAYRSALGELDASGGGSPNERAEALAGCAWAEAIAGDPDGADELLREVQSLVGQAPMEGLLAPDVGIARGHVLVRRGQLTESFAPFIAAGEAALRAGRPDMTWACWMNAASAAAAAGQFDRALGFADRTRPALRAAGLRRLEAETGATRGHILARLARPDEAVAAAEEALGIARDVDDEQLVATVEHDLGHVAFATSDPARAEALLARALAAEAPMSRPLARLTRAEALVSLERLEEAEEELRAVALEPVGASDFPSTLVARLTRVQGLLALARGERGLARRRLEESGRGWERHLGAVSRTGDEFMANLIDLGRPPVVGLVEPARELDRLRAELAELDALEAVTPTGKGG
jgi:DNA-binding SARP family transcriptional activator